MRAGVRHLAPKARVGKKGPSLGAERSRNRARNLLVQSPGGNGPLLARASISNDLPAPHGWYLRARPHVSVIWAVSVAVRNCGRRDRASDRATLAEDRRLELSPRRMTRCDIQQATRQRPNALSDLLSADHRPLRSC